MEIEVMYSKYDEFKELMALWKSMSRGMEVEPDYKRFDELMNFWKSMPLAMHVSWHEALETASALPEGKRSLSKLRRLVTKARNDATIDLCDLELKLQLGSSRVWDKWIEEKDLDHKIPAIFGRLLGMKEPDKLMDNVWQSYFIPLAATRQMASVCEVVNDILQLMHVGRHFLGYGDVQESVDTQFESFKSCLRMNLFRAWRHKLKLEFPELLDKHLTDEMRAALGEEFCDWVEEQDNWLWSEEV
ncbi:uncharacterized protein Triagg1_441 [Trichoderma aggressivum f. europaeum]|uniref:Uncharacterized protein n=1 Tax=Trichoderma aggressivum f. europaeum TaxID=173218 RepID=A0AAE1MA52_9HYPO|nr:hypothetical protein Triagg1_441 [Trichoderma aggressivum f. europaeum]